MRPEPLYFKKISEAREYFMKYVLPEIKLDEEESVEVKYQDWVEQEGVTIAEEIEDTKSFYQDYNTCHEQ